MYLIDVIALIWLVIAITTLIIGTNTGDSDTISGGMLILVSLILMSFAFHSGAAWQTIDIKQKYFLIKKEKPFP